MVVLLVVGLLAGIVPLVYHQARHILGLYDPTASSDGVTLRTLPLRGPVAYSPDGHTLAGWSDNGTVELWDVDKGTRRHVLPFAVNTNGRYSYREVVFAPDGDTVATELNDGRTIQIWDTRTGATLTVIKVPLTHPDGLVPLRASKLVYSSDSRTIAATGDHLQLWDVATGTRRHQIDVSARDAAFAPDGRTIAAVAERQGGIWDVATGAQVHPLDPSGGHFRTVGFAPDGRTVVADGDRVRAWDTATGAVRWSSGLYEGDKPVYAPDGSLLAERSGDDVWLVDPESGKKLRTLRGLHGLLIAVGNYAQVGQVAWAPDSRTLVVRHDTKDESWANTPQVWDVKTGTALQLLKGHKGPVYDVAYSPDGRTITTVSGDGTARIWRATP
ncbi:PQQ-binding-like beta-propeller repeat protein [Streptomyces sp. D2-8]|uniref:WD40 repeat domain-containing protein n=1 Tax=Streptomyces sp. D2-8 TaxID=2707767 RepID=UPI0020C14BD7|nr:PQQ-binding-like beta-propeller repeat protein [Streptomyces sp. D2-8]MCK8437015.1 PQQ-binding-like beta-propeller repeat protein [Streptomyces sp. D2-8]